MKSVLRIMVLIISNLLTLPFQLVVVAIICLTSWTNDEQKELVDECEETLNVTKHWIKTGRFEEPED